MNSGFVAAWRGFLRPLRSLLLLGLALVETLPTARAAEPWIAPGNVQLRHDLELLVDSGVINLPISTWPIAVSDLAHALSSAEAHKPGDVSKSKGAAGERFDESQLTPAQRAAWLRLSRAASRNGAVLGFDVAAAGRPTVLRTFEDTPREEGELSVHAAGFLGTRYGARLEVTGVINPDDDKSVRLDGSYVAGKFGNWILTAGAQDRWWGGGWEGSLILSNNARPVPAIAIDRAVSEPFKTKWLSWIGPWRLTTFMGRMENGRQDYDHPLLFGMRITARPVEGLELAVDRTAQWCGEGRSCTLSDFKNLFFGHDNAGENVNPEDEPGNQLASYGLRWSSPVGDGPYALYWQHTGESIDNHIPRPYRTFDLVGIQGWGDTASDGSSWRTGIEYADTKCGGTQDGRILWDCAYNNHIFDPDGYRYYGRPLGHSMDGDGTMYSARFVRVDASANTLTAVARYTLVNRGGAVPDVRNSVAPGPENWISFDVTYRRLLGTGWVEAGAGVDHRDRNWDNTSATLPRAYLRWTQPFE